jgi:uncharacterized damage-inducible protein DinB
MIDPAYVRTMAAYNAEMNRRWYAAAATLTDAQRNSDEHAFFRSLHGTLCHILGADRIWMWRLGGWPAPTARGAETASFIPGFADLAAARIEADASIVDWAGRVTPKWLAQDLVWFSGGSQQEMRKPRTMLVTHLFNHQTHHRGQAHALLTRFGADPGATDLPWVL